MPNRSSRVRKVRSVRVSRGRSRIDVSIPDDVCRAAQIEPGALVDVRAESGRIVLVPLRTEEER